MKWPITPQPVDTMAFRSAFRSALVLTTLFVAACSDDTPGVAGVIPTTTDPVAARVQCTVNVSTSAMTCGAPEAPAGMAAARGGGQGTYTYLKSSNVLYSAGVFSAD